LRKAYKESEVEFYSSDGDVGLKWGKGQDDIVMSQAIRLAGLAEYQEGSVVSRTIIDKNAGTVTFFAFDEGQRLSEHRAPYDALVYVLDGEADIVISDKSVRVEEGEMVMIPANKPHVVKAVKKFKMILMMIRS
jgi:quercetin dioxygenase-like cupin family protein